MRYIIEVSYLGSDFHGWQIQPNANTVQEEIEKALSLVLGENTPITGSSRTDVGVHACQQFAHFDTNVSKINLHKTRTRLNKILPASISILNIYTAFPEKHTRFDAINRKYIYRISKFKNPFFGKISAFYPHEYDLQKMNEAAKYLFKYENFKSFSKVKTEVKTFNCLIEHAEWMQNGDILEFHIKANRFLRGMVRAIVGSLLDVGSGKKTINDFEQIILAEDRTKAGNAAKPEGLTLEEVNYPANYFENKFEIIKATEKNLPTLHALFVEYQKSLRISLCFQNFDAELASLPKPYDEPNGCILILKVETEIVGVVALKCLEEGICEMKRLYIKPAYQGFGFGRKLTEKLIEEAKVKKYKIMKLDTLNRLEAAVKLYRSMDFIETKPYNYNPEEDILYFEKGL